MEPVTVPELISRRYRWRATVVRSTLKICHFFEPLPFGVRSPLLYIVGFRVLKSSSDVSSTLAQTRVLEWRISRQMEKVFSYTYVYNRIAVGSRLHQTLHCPQLAVFSVLVINLDSINWNGIKGTINTRMVVSDDIGEQVQERVG
ncbi:hypothetical protein KQX54_007203 [Cotesia glomerata]|uniref:Uncharacterized protein n=1 Tax=Cotesia glomerata TaxID=32391 RepID=A0AAV7IA43_COTGL|nr:hypothetical protein KQX54_007203 [Cotesia glomerata]